MIRAVDGGVALDVLVSPRSSRARIGPVHDDRIKVAVTAPPVDGAANKAVVELFAKKLGVPRRSVAITAGESSRRKTVVITGVAADRVRGLVE